jgi:hypothetical protein
MSDRGSISGRWHSVLSCAHVGFGDDNPPSYTWGMGSSLLLGKATWVLQLSKQLRLYARLGMVGSVRSNAIVRHRHNIHLEIQVSLVEYDAVRWVLK